MSMILHSDLLPTGRVDAAPWWMNAVLYQIYPRSFQDSDGDGVGDLQGIVRRLDYLAQLGVDIVWISPIYRSPQADNGYDISGYRDIDPLFGDLETFDALVARAHDLGMRIVMDLVVNHTSVEHPWFIESATGPDSARRDWYYWRDPRPGAVPGHTRRGALELGILLRGACLGVRPGLGPVLPAPVRARAAGPELGESPGSRRRLRHDELVARSRR